MSESVLGRLTLGQSGLAFGRTSFSLFARIGFFGDFRSDAIILRERSSSFQVGSVVQITRSSEPPDPWLTPWTIKVWLQRTVVASTTVNAVIFSSSYVRGSTAIRPNSDLAKSGTINYIPSGSDGWALVDEVVYSGSDYYRLRSVGATITHGFTSSGLPSDAIIERLTPTINFSNPAVSWDAYWYLRNPATGSEYLLMQRNQQGNETVSVPLLTRPWDSQPWTTADVDAVQTRQTIPAVAANLYVYHLYATVSWRYTPRFAADAIRHQHHVRSFSVGSWFRHDNYAEFSTTADAAKLETFTSSTKVDAWVSHNLKLDAVILSPHYSGIVSSGGVVSSSYGVDISWTHTQASGDTCLVVVLYGVSGSQATSITYGGLPLTPVIYDSSYGELWVLTDLTQRRADDIIRVDNAKNVRGASVMLRSQNPVSIVRSTFHAAANHNGQYLSNTLARYPAVFSSAVAVHFASAYYGSTPATAYSPAAGTTFEGFLLRSASSPGYWGVVGTTPSIGVGDVTGGFDISDTNPTGMLSILLQSALNEGESFNTAALVLGVRTGWRTINAWLAGRFSLDAIYSGYQGAIPADAVIWSEIAGSFAVESRIRLEETFESGFSVEAEITMGGTFSIDVWISGVFAVDAYVAGTRTGSFALSAFILTGRLVDNKSLAVAFSAPALNQTIKVGGEFSSFTSDASDPNYEYLTSGNSGWMRLDVAEESLLFIECFDSDDSDPDLAIWGPQAAAPISTQAPWHYNDYADNARHGYRPGLSDTSPESPQGSLYTAEVNSASFGSGLTVQPGSYWLAVWPYRGGTASGYIGINITRRSPSTPGSFAAEAWIAGRFRVDAKTIGAPGEVIPIPSTVDWVQQSTVLGAVPGRQATLVAVGSGTAGASVNLSSLPVNRPSSVAGDFMVAFISGDENGVEREIWSPGWTKFAYIPFSDHSHAAWILTRTLGQYDPGFYTFYWGDGSTGSMAVSIAAWRARLGTTVMGASIGMLRTVADLTVVPSNQPHYHERIVGYAGQRVILAHFGNAYTFATWTLVPPPGGTMGAYTQGSTNYATVRIGEIPIDQTLAPDDYYMRNAQAMPRLNAALVIMPTPVTGWTVDAWLFRGIRVNALKGQSFSSSFSVNAVRVDMYVEGSFTVDAYYEHGGVFIQDAIVIGPVLSSKTINAVKFQYDYGQGTFSVDAAWAIARRFILKATKFKEAASSVTVDAWVSGRTIRVDARIHDPDTPFVFFYANSIRKRNMTSSLKVDASIRSSTRMGAFAWSAITRVPVQQGTITGSFSADAVVYALWGTVIFSGETGWPIDAVVDSWWSETTFTIDASITELDRYGDFTAGADIAAAGDTRGVFAVASAIGTSSWDLFPVRAVIAQGVFHLHAYIASVFTVDAVIVYQTGSGSFTANAALLGPVTGEMGVDAMLFAVGPQSGAFALTASLEGYASGSFDLDAHLGGAITLDAFIRTGFYANAYITTGEMVVYPPSQDGTVGTVVGGVFTDPTADFDSSLVGSIIVINGEEYVIVAVIDGQTLVIEEIGGGTPPDVAPSPWSIPSGQATDAYGGPPPVTRSNRIRILWARPFTDDWSDVTADVLWSRCRFSQSARVGAGTFELHLEGSWPFVGGEEIRVEVDGFVTFGGYTMEVERGFLFPDLASPVTVLHGTDYNIVLDKLVVYNAAWDERQGGSGEYKIWQPFAKGTSDHDIITTIARRYISPMPGFDFTAHVDEIESPAPTKRWTMQAGSTLRDVLTEISRITEGVWWIDPYRNLHYHDRSTVSAPFPITDGDGGISCRELSVSSDISIVTNDVIAWGTEAYQEYDNGILYSHQIADAPWSVIYWEDKIEDVQRRIDAIRDIPYDERTVRQRADLSALKRAKAVYQRKLEKAEAAGGTGSVQRFGRWQYGEFRQDIYHQRPLDRRARAILSRYGEPVQKASAIVFDHGFQAGQVAFVSSMTHGIADEMVIREMTMEFATIKEPVGETYHAVPRYRLSLGLDPEEPWNIYQFLPFRDYDYEYPGIHINPPAGWILEPGEVAGSAILDDFTRDYESDTDFGLSTSERIEVRAWEAEA